MFGYILPEKPELKIREYEIFRAYYCGVCKSIGRRYGQIPRLALNYDSTFLAILLSSLVDEKLTLKNERCIAHPVKKRLAVKDNFLVDYASDMNLILAYYKLEDDWKDEKSIPAVTGTTILKSAFKKLRSKYEEKCGIIEKRLQELAELEKNKCSSMDMAAEPFAKLMEEITAYKDACPEENTQTILRWTGYNLGKWIYILDAFDDIEKDIRKGTYNPLLNQFEYKPGEEICSFKDRVRPKVEFNLTYCLGQIAKAYELLDKKSQTGLIENIIYMGMLRKTEQILKAGSCSKIEKSV